MLLSSKFKRNKAIVDSRLRPRCGITPLTIYFLNLSLVNDKLISLFYIHASPQAETEERHKRAKNCLCKGVDL